jgi:hypothetical protein
MDGVFIPFYPVGDMLGRNHSTLPFFFLLFKEYEEQETPEARFVKGLYCVIV